MLGGSCIYHRGCSGCRRSWQLLVWPLPRSTVHDDAGRGGSNSDTGRSSCLITCRGSRERGSSRADTELRSVEPPPTIADHPVLDEHPEVSCGVPTAVLPVEVLRPSDHRAWALFAELWGAGGSQGSPCCRLEPGCTPVAVPGTPVTACGASAVITVPCPHACSISPEAVRPRRSGLSLALDKT